MTGAAALVIAATAATGAFAVDRPFMIPWPTTSARYSSVRDRGTD